MTNKKSTKRALLFSVLSLVLCFSMLVGTTFAWFTDSVTSGNNVIISGNLDIELEYWNGTEWDDVEGKSDIITNNLWEPGVAEVAYLRIKNAGSLALKYQLGVNIVSETSGTNAAGETFKLSDYIMFGVVEGVNGETGAYANRAAAVAAVAEAKKISAGYTKAATMASNNELYLALVVWMPESVGNEANHKTGTEAPKINLGINIVATQEAFEEDAFGPDYDKDAAFITAPVERPDDATADMNLKGANDVVISLPEDVIDALPAGVEEIGMAVSDPVVDATAKTITFASIELVDQNGDVIDLEALNTNTNITVTLPAQTTFAPGETVVLYHDGEYVATAVVNADTTISYEVAHLCEVSVGAVEVPAEKDGVIEIANVAQLFGFAQEVNSGKNYYEGKTVVLTADIDLKNAEWTPIGSATADHGFMGNFDGDGYKIKNLSITNIALDADNYAYAGFFGVTEGDAGAENVIKNLVIENVTINTKGHIVAAAIAYPYYTTLENITVCGDIAISGGDYTSGVLAYTRRCTTASNISISGNEGSYITGGITVGGVISDIQMNGGLTANYSNFSASNVTVTGNKNVGGISGIISKQTLNGATVENVTLVCGDNHVGIVSGAYDSNPVINDVIYENVTGTAAIVGAPYGKDNNVVTIDGVEYVGVKTADELKAALATSGNYILVGNIALDAGDNITVPAGVTATLNLNGYTISGTDNGTASFGLITNKGNLTIAGEGKITLAATQNRGWNAYSSVISNQPGGKLVVENGTLEHLGGTDMAYAIDNLTNGKGTYAETVINGGTIKSTYRAIRMFLNGIEAQNILTVNGGVIEGANKSIWMQDPSANANSGTLTVSENAVLNGDVYVYVTPGSTEFPATVAIADKALSEESEVVEGNLASVNKAMANVNGVWTLVAAN